MAQCKWCDRKGFFLSTNEFGLCKSCALEVVVDVQNQSRIIGDCIKLVDQSKKFDTRLSRCELLIEKAEALLKYEQKGILTINPPPSNLLMEYKPKYDQIILDDVIEMSDKMFKKAEIATNAR